MLDFQKLIDLYFSRWKWIHVFAAMALSCICILMASSLVSKTTVAEENRRAEYYSKISDSGRLVSRWRNRDDPRGFLDLADDTPLSKTFGIAWVSGSSISVRGAPEEWRIRDRPGYNLTEAFAAYAKTANDQNVTLHQYLLQGARSADIRRALLHALEDPNSDLVLVPINSVWVLNDWLTFTKSSQRAENLTRKNKLLLDYRVAASVLSPLEYILGKTEKSDGLYAHRSLIAKAWGADKIKPFLVHSGAASDGNALNKWQAWFFPPSINQGYPESVKWLKGYRALMLMQDIEGAASRDIFQANIQSAAESGKPVLFYITPLPPELKDDPILMEFLNTLFAAMKEDGEKYGGENTRMITETAFDTPQPYKHRDMIHLHHGQGLVEKLIALVEAEFGLSIERNSVESIYAPTKKKDAKE